MSPNLFCNYSQIQWMSSEKKDGGGDTSPLHPFFRAFLHEQLRSFLPKMKKSGLPKSSKFMTNYHIIMSET